jgi:hypothetical protein
MSYYLIMVKHIIFQMIQSKKSYNVKIRKSESNSENSKSLFTGSKRRLTPYRRGPDYVSLAQWPDSSQKTYIVCENRTQYANFTKSALFFSKSYPIQSPKIKTNMYHIHTAIYTIIPWFYNPQIYHMFKTYTYTYINISYHHKNMTNHIHAYIHQNC